MKKFINPHKAPPGGWRFIDPDTQYRFDRGYRSLEEMLGHIERYRKQNNLRAIPKLRAVVENWICHQPNCASYCKDFTPAKRFVQGAVGGAKALVQGEDGLVPIEEAERRAAICLNCPFNVEPRKSQLKEHTDEAILALTDSHTTSKDGQLKSCSICDCPLRAKVHFAREIFEDSIDTQQQLQLPNGQPGLDGKPLFCWQLREDIHG